MAIADYYLFPFFFVTHECDGRRHLFFDFLVIFEVGIITTACVIEQNRWQTDRTKSEKYAGCKSTTLQVSSVFT